MLIRLIRLEGSPNGTLGVLKINSEIFCATLEPPYLSNIPEISCIPKGIYVCKKIKSPKYGETFEVMDVIGRSHILFHSGNTVDHTAGCILLGEYFGKLRGDRAVLNSGKTFEKFLSTMASVDVFALHIRCGF